MGLDCPSHRTLRNNTPDEGGIPKI